MDNPRPEKVAVVDEVRQKLRDAEATVLTEYRGLNVPAMARLRDEVRSAGGEVKVYKNTLVRFAAQDLGLEIEDLLTGPTAMAFVGPATAVTAGDAVTLAKALRRYAGENDKLVIKGGLLGSQRLSAEEVRALAEVAPREQLLAELAGLMAAPLQQVAGMLGALQRDLAYVISALIDRRGGVPDDEADETPAAEAADETPAAEAADETPAAEAADETPAAEAAADPTES